MLEFLQHLGRVGRVGVLGTWTVPTTCGLVLPLHAVAVAAGRFLADPRRHHVRACASERCGRLFADRTGQRRWCSVATCKPEDRAPY